MAILRMGGRTPEGDEADFYLWAVEPIVFDQPPLADTKNSGRSCGPAGDSHEIPISPEEMPPTMHRSGLTYRGRTRGIFITNDWQTEFSRPPAWFRYGVIAIATLILCSCQAVNPNNRNKCRVCHRTCSWDRKAIKLRNSCPTLRRSCLGLPCHAASDAGRVSRKSKRAATIGRASSATMPRRDARGCQLPGCSCVGAVARIARSSDRVMNTCAMVAITDCPPALKPIGK